MTSEKCGNYVIKLKNTDIIKITKEQYSKLVIALADNPPVFININGEIIKTDCIATIRQELW